MYNYDVILMQRCKPNFASHKYVLQKVDFCVQFHSLPVEYLNENFDLKLVKGIGEPKPMILRENEKWVKFARANVNLNVIKPLCQSIELSLTNEVEII